MAKKLHNAITDIPGIQVGHAQDFEAVTGCTVVICEDGAIPGIDQRGGGPATHETDVIKPINHENKKAHAILLTGGSAYGLNANLGVMRYLEEKDIGYDTMVAKVPIVPTASIFDLNIGAADVRPTPEMSYQACQNATDQPPAQGSVGVGTGATVGKMLGMGFATKAGVGTASMEIGSGVLVGALVVVNAVGDVIDPATDQIIAGARRIEKGPIKIGKEGVFADTMELMKGLVGRTIFSLADRSNTVIGVVATNADLSKPYTTKVAQMGMNGVVRTIRPTNTMHDGDTIFALSTGKKKADVNIVGAFAAQVVQQAILNAVHTATSLVGVPSFGELFEGKNSE
ncbi:MAG: P1 family peptidase [Anaerolineales bacterium]